MHHRRVNIGSIPSVPASEEGRALALGCPIKDATVTYPCICKRQRQQLRISLESVGREGKIDFTKRSSCTSGSSLSFEARLTVKEDWPEVLLIKSRPPMSKWAFPPMRVEWRVR